MHWFRRIFHKEQSEKHLDAELRFHLEKQIADYVASGVSPEEARRRAQLDFGGLESIKQQTRESRRGNLLETLFQDLRYAARMLRKNPGFSAVAILTLGLGIAASTAIFSVVSAGLLRPLPYRAPSRLVWADEFVPHINDWAVPNPEFTNWSTHNRTFEAMAAYDGGSQSNLTGAGEPERIETSGVTANFLGVLGVHPALGRGFLPSEDRPGGPLVALLTDSLWRRKFSTDPGIVGKSIDLDAQTYTVVGVLPASFRFPDRRETPQCLFAFRLSPEVDWAAQTLRLTRVIGRLAQGVSLSQAQADLAALAAQSNSVMPAALVRTRDGLQVQLTPLHDKIVGDVRLALLVLLAAVLFVLLIACVNVANLQLVRTASRHKELAVRTAIGAGRARLIQQLLTEGASLAAMGGAAGMLVAAIGIRLLRISLPATIAQIGIISIDRRVLLFAIIITCLTAILFGLAPAFRASKPNVKDALKEGGSRATSLYIHRRSHGALVAVEFTLAFLLLIGSGLLIRSFIRLSNVAPGFDPTNVLTVSTELPDSKYSTDQQRQAFFSLILERIHSLPSVHSVGLTTQLPFSPVWGSFSFLIEGQPEPPRGTAPMVFADEVSSDYFQTMRIPMLTGRSFTPSDLAPDSHAIIVSAAFARRFLPAGAPLSKRVRLHGFESPWSTVVGVAGDVHYAGLDHVSDPQVYVPYFGENAASIVIRSDGDPRSLVFAVRAQFATTDPLQPVFDISTMQQRIEGSIEIQRSNMTLITSFASLALVLTAVGIYGVIAYFVSGRTHEIGIRMALGAAASDVLRLVVSQGLVMILTGLTLGLASSLLLTRYIASLLYDVHPFDPLTLICVAVLLVCVALAACYVPARRATRVDPMTALRYE
ncbi:MAG: ABC transporter permease [Candidatus Acidiferrum sp.]